ncbi:endonuclease/exonuclease/phosphatase family protein [Microlunatus sp. Y2014]|uniref:endonuclease/exonuclease/phosphatase family protein n=1 Tax=Microlunatus sp. Y2014 TaxID=3418488 RepID=UPI003DA78F02
MSHDVTLSRRGLIALAGGAAAAGVAGLALPTPARAEESAPAGGPVPVRVMTYNIHAGANAQHVFDLQPQIEVIRESGADIVGMQEVDHHWSARSDWISEVEVMAEALGMFAFFGPILDNDPINPGEPRRQFGCATLSKYPFILTQDHEILRYADGRYAFGFPQVRVNVDGAHVDVFNSHLDYRGDPFIRTGQNADMIRIASQFTGQQILLGDLNARPAQPEMQPLWEHWDDAWLAEGEGPGYTFNAITPDRRIDYILLKNGPQVTNIEVLDTQASDHRPLVADILLRRGRNG